MYRREECLVHASICREKAQTDPVRSDHWIDRAITWHQRAAQARHENAVAREMHDGLFPAPKETAPGRGSD